MRRVGAVVAIGRGFVWSTDRTIRMRDRHARVAKALEGNPPGRIEIAVALKLFESAGAVEKGTHILMIRRSRVGQKNC